MSPGKTPEENTIGALTFSEACVAGRARCDGLSELAENGSKAQPGPHAGYW